jgi:DNA-binding transcriptional regulator YiaG
MNKYRAGSDLEFWLSTWSNKGVSLNRRTSKNAFIESPIIPVLGGIQPGILNGFFSSENKDNGFVDRMLTCYPDVKIEEFSDAEMDEEVHEWYNSYILNFYDKIKKEYLLKDTDDEIISHVALLSPEAKSEYKRIDKEITAIQNSDIENEYMKSMLPKQKSYIPRFSLLLNTLWSFIDEKYPYQQVQKESILRAEKLSEYFVNMAKLVKQDAREKTDLKSVSKDKNNTFDKFKAMYEADSELNKSVVAEMLDVSRKTIYEWVKKLEK